MFVKKPFKGHPGSLQDGSRANTLQRHQSLYDERLETVGTIKINGKTLRETCGRSGEVSGAEWPKLDLDASMPTIPGERMKARKAHQVPLPHAAIAIVASMPHVDRYEFASRKESRPISELLL